MLLVLFREYKIQPKVKAGVGPIHDGQILGVWFYKGPMPNVLAGCGKGIDNEHARQFAGCRLLSFAQYC